MKKYIGILILGFLFVPVFSFAQVGDVDPNAGSSTCVNIVNNLRYKDRDIDKNGEVSVLQDFLQSNGYLNSEPTGYLGLLTVKAVKSFQSSNNINPTGYVGPITLAKVNDLICSSENADSTTSAPVVSVPTTTTSTFLPGCFDGYKFSATTGLACDGSQIPTSTYVALIPNTTLVTSTGDSTPRIMYWYGKVNQHVDADGNWRTDPDGVSGANLDKLTYCQKWFPSTTSVVDYKNETIGTWMDKGNVQDLTNLSAYYATKMSTKCVQGTPDPTPTQTITVLSPSGGESFTVGQQQIKVAWTSSNIDQSSNVKLGLYVNIGNNYGVVSSTTVTNNGQNVINIPSSAQSGTYEVIVDNGNVLGTSNPFTITAPAPVPATTIVNTTSGCTSTSAPSVIVVSPNGGESYTAGQQATVQWTSCNYSSQYNVGIGFYSTNTGDIGKPISVPNTGSATVTIPSASTTGTGTLTSGKYYMVYIDMNGNINAGDFSDNAFTINSTVSISQPSSMMASALGAFNSAAKVEQPQNGGTILPAPAPAPTSTCATFTTLLKRGMDDPQVKCLQKILTQKGFKIEGIPTGSETTFFGHATQDALKAFQTKNNLIPDGRLGPKTIAILENAQ